MIELRAVPGKTGRLLAQLLAEKRVNLTEGPTQAIVSYGCRVDSTLPVLNGNAGKLNKFEELQALDKRGIQTIPYSKDPYTDLWCASAALRNEKILGRNLKHTKGRDIKVFEGEGAYSLLQPRYRCDFYTQYIPQKAEFRVWAFRGRCLGVYQKTLEFPRKARRRPGIAWNWRRGYAFKFFHDAPEALKQLGIDAIRALDLDFGAVDIIQAIDDDQFYVLEVNTAPGTQGPRQGLTYLATKIARWYENGFKKRNEWKEKL